MKNFVSLSLAVGILLSTSVVAQSNDTFSASEPYITSYAPSSTLRIPGNSSLLDTRDGMINGPGAGSGGADASILQNSSLGMNTFGFVVHPSSSARVADDFDVPVPGWTISDVTVYGYQTFSPTTSTITAMNFRIWDGPPNQGTSSVIFGDDFTNVLSSTAFTNIFREADSTPGITNRPIMSATASGLSIKLPAGTYWLDFQLDGSLASRPQAPPLTIGGMTTTGNGLQSFGAPWGPANDTGTITQQGFPLTIGGAVNGVPVDEVRELPTNSKLLILALLVGLLVLGVPAIKRR